jgi:hypothetical protein
MSLCIIFNKIIIFTQRNEIKDINISENILKETKINHILVTKLFCH